MRHQDETFIGDPIELGENQFINCTFDDCRLIYDGSPGARIENCSFDQTRLELTGEAGNTLSFLQNIYHGFGEDGQAVVENLFDQIRQGRIGEGDMPPREQR